MSVLVINTAALQDVLPSGDIDVLTDGIQRLGLAQSESSLGLSVVSVPPRHSRAPVHMLGPPAPSAAMAAAVAQSSLPPPSPMVTGVAMALIVPAPQYGPEFGDCHHPPPLDVRFPSRCNCDDGSGVCVVESGGLLRCGMPCMYV